MFPDECSIKQLIFAVTFVSVILLFVILLGGFSELCNERFGTIKIIDKSYNSDGNIEVIDHNNKTWVLNSGEGALYYFIEPGNMYFITYTENTMFQKFMLFPPDRHITTIRKVTEFVI